MQFEIRAPKGSVWETVTIAAAALSLVLVIVNAGLVLRNQSIQVDVSQRQQVINQGLQLARIRQALAQYIANVATAKKDSELTDVLTHHGITLAAPPAAPAPAAPQGK
ncbi:MAG TPA: hypothetical protein VHY80_09375 [Stellaceae bacterium]|jgi:hypothetical protein|nr:hypothetical protein [Stellaceae bacterium]